MTTRKNNTARAIVTGAGSGIGRSLALELARRGAQVVCADINGPTAEAVAHQINSDGGTAFAFGCDVGVLEQVEEMSAFARDSFSAPASMVVNNAGIGVGGEPIGRISIEDWRRTLDVNLWGVIHGCHVFVPQLRAQAGGSIINIASAAAFAAGPQMAAYNVSKAGVLSLSETLAAELSGTKVEVSVVCPTFVKTAIADNDHINPKARAAAARGMRLTGRSPDRVARQILDAHDAGTFMILPQIEARMIYAMKRGTPGLYRHICGRAARGLGQA